MRGKLALIGAMAVLLSSTSVNAAGKKAPQDGGTQTAEPQTGGNIPNPAQPKIKKSNALLPGIGAVIAAGVGGAAAGGALDPNSP